jgi:hypothetical protein
MPVIGAYIPDHAGSEGQIFGYGFLIIGLTGRDACATCGEGFEIAGKRFNLLPGAGDLSCRIDG